MRRYLLFAADPYEVIAFKVPNVEVDKSEGRLFTHCECACVYVSVHACVRVCACACVRVRMHARMLAPCSCPSPLALCPGSLFPSLPRCWPRAAGDPDSKVYSLQFNFRNRGERMARGGGAVHTVASAGACGPASVPAEPGRAPRTHARARPHRAHVCAIASLSSPARRCRLRPPAPRRPAPPSPSHGRPAPPSRRPSPHGPRHPPAPHAPLHAAAPHAPPRRPAHAPAHAPAPPRHATGLCATARHAAAAWHAATAWHAAPTPTPRPHGPPHGRPARAPAAAAPAVRAKPQ